jgi:SCY1-like protein 1
MKLGGAKAKGKSTTNSALDEVMGDWDDEGPENAWGTDDLIDVNADDDDWGKSETCLLA